MITKDIPVEKHLRAAADRALRYYDEGNQSEAVGSFLNDLGAHDQTRRILSSDSAMRTLRVGALSSRCEFEQIMLGLAAAD